MNNTPHSQGALAGLHWIKRSINLLTRQPIQWVIAGLIFMGINLLLALLPIIGFFIAVLITPLLMAGFSQCAQDADKTGQFSINTVFSGADNHFNRLLLLGFILLVLSLLSLIPPAYVLTDYLTTNFPSGKLSLDPKLINELALSAISLKSYQISLLLSSAIMIPVQMCCYFAPTLILLENHSVLSAMRLSFYACIKNVLPFLLYSVLLFILLFISLIPLGIGLMITLPLTLIGIYTSYDDIFKPNTQTDTHTF